MNPADSPSGVVGVTDQPGAKRMWWMLAVLLLVAWEGWPALTSVHIEGFSASLESMSLLWNLHGRAGLLLADQNYPLTTEYLYLTRSGLVHGVAWMMRLTGQRGDLAFRLLMLLSLLIFTASCIYVAHRWSGYSWVRLLAVAALTPGIFESSFSFSDNLASASFAMLALAVVVRPAPSWRWVLAGACMGSAFLVRVDAVLVLPGLLFCAMQDRPRLAILAGRLLTVLLAMTAILGLAQWQTPFRIKNALKITHLFNSLQSWRLGPKHMLIGFFGVIVLALLACGVAREFRTRNRFWILAVIGYPCLIYCYAILRAPDIRDFTLLGVPAVLILGASGTFAIEGWFHSERRLVRLGGFVAVLVFAAVFLAPTTVFLDDGPRAMTGRLYAPFVWHEWQSDVNAGMEQLQVLIDSGKSGEPRVFLATSFNADRYFRLRLLQSGYDVVALGAMPESCGGVADIFERGSRTVILFRTENPYGAVSTWYHYPLSYVTDFLVDQDVSCLLQMKPSQVSILNWGPNDPVYASAGLATASSEVWSYPRLRTIPARGHVKYGRIKIGTANAQQLSLLLETARRQEAVKISKPRVWTPLSSYSEWHALVSAHFWRL